MNKKSEKRLQHLEMIQKLVTRRITQIKYLEKKDDYRLEDYEELAVQISSRIRMETEGLNRQDMDRCLFAVERWIEDLEGRTDDSFPTEADIVRTHQQELAAYEWLKEKIQKILLSV